MTALHKKAKLSGKIFRQNLQAKSWRGIYLWERSVSDGIRQTANVKAFSQEFGSEFCKRTSNK
jgi:hypothetical protein